MVRMKRTSPLLVALLLALAVPLAASAQGNKTAKHHNLPRGSASTVTVFTFGIAGGNIRPWSAKLILDGTVQVDGIDSTRQQLADPKNTLKGLLALADAEGFFSLKKAVGCLGTAGNVDASHRFLSIHTSAGTKKVAEYGSCAATAKYDQLFDVVQGTAGVGS